MTKGRSAMRLILAIVLPLIELAGLAVIWVMLSYL
jgi:hypothetical protein